MSGRWQGRESPPHSPPTDELGHWRRARRGLGPAPAPQAPEPPRSLGLWSPFTARILERGTRPALSHRLLEGGAAAPGASEGKAWAKRSREPRSWVSGPHHPGAQPRLPARRVLSLPCCAPAFREKLPSPGSSFRVPFPSKSEEV